MSTKDLRDHNDLCVGIDLGTTNSVLATINEKPNGDIVSKVVEISRGVDMYNAISGEAKLTKMKKPTLPSCVYYRQEQYYEPMVGDFAKMQYPLRPHLVAKSIKSQMGQLEAKGLSSDIPDKSPAQISARILKHMLNEASRIYRCDITDAVITVPANFDSAMCEATRNAAELAGIKIRNEDGTERPVLLSEPNAVIYDLINQIHNGEISNRILDLNEQKRVLVFDLGGGTLDITMHEIKRREDNLNVLKVDEIATNRYTLLGGDDFDEEIAKAMYERYIKQFASHPEIVSKLRQDEKIIMPQLRVYAEHLKLELNERCCDDYASGWDDPDDEIEIPVGGNMGGIGYSYDDTFSQEEIEKILSVFMAKNLHYEDYKQLDSIKDNRNIIYPVLEVLKKASEKLGIDDVKVDSVIVNGGMSKFYMITERLKEFFGFEPIVALDPDQAVARGAAVYHYYLHKYDEMKDDMKMLGISECTDQLKLASGYDISKDREPIMVKPSVSNMAIQWGKSILNDSLYLGVKNGAVHKIIPTGMELPYTSEVMTGFSVEPGQSIVSIPIKSQNVDGTFRTIACGNISFRSAYKDGAYVAFKIHMNSNKVITMNAWTSKDENGMERIEEGCVEIAIDNGERNGVKTKFIAPSGAILQPKSEVNNLLQLCINLEKCKNKMEKSTLSKRIASSVKGICCAGNKEKFADVILEALSNETSEEFRQRLFVIARKIGNDWSEKDKNKLAVMAMEQVSADLNGFHIGGAKTNTNIQAIYTMSMCANQAQLNRIIRLHDSPRYLQSCLYTHAKTRTSVDWIYTQFMRDAEWTLSGRGSNVQFSSYALGIALKKQGEVTRNLSIKEETKCVKTLCDLVCSGRLISEELTCCIIALGCICDTRFKNTEFSGNIMNEVLDTIQNAYKYNGHLNMTRQDKVSGVAIKMINGEILDEIEEQFLLTKLEK